MKEQSRARQSSQSSSMRKTTEQRGTKAKRPASSPLEVSATRPTLSISKREAEERPAAILSLRTTTLPELHSSIQVSSRKQHSALHMLELEESQIVFPPTPCRSMDSSYGLRSQSRRRSLVQVVQDLSMTVGTMESDSELSSLAPLHNPVFEPDNTTEERTEDDTLTHSTQPKVQHRSTSLILKPSLLMLKCAPHLSLGQHRLNCTLTQVT